MPPSLKLVSKKWLDMASRSYWYIWLFKLEFISAGDNICCSFHQLNWGTICQWYHQPPKFAKGKNYMQVKLFNILCIMIYMILKVGTILQDSMQKLPSQVTKVHKFAADIILLTTPNAPYLHLALSGIFVYLCPYYFNGNTLVCDLRLRFAIAIFCIRTTKKSHAAAIFQ